MRSSSWRVLPSIAALALTGCVQHTFAPGPGMSVVNFEPDSAKCRIFARGASPDFGFSASGSPKFVAGSLVGAAIGAAVATAVVNNHNFNDCMEASGWRVVDNVKPAPGADVARPSPPPQVEATPLPPVAVVTASTTLAPAVVPLSPIPLANRRELLIKAAAVSKETAVSLRMDAPRGVVLLDVVAGGAAASSGLMPGDVILAFNGTPVGGLFDLTQDLDRVPAGGQAQVRIWRNDAERWVTVRF